MSKETDAVEAVTKKAAAVLGKSDNQVKVADKGEILASIWKQAYEQAEIEMKKEFESVKHELKDSGDQAAFEKLTKDLLRETIESYKAETDSEKNYHQRNIEHLRNGLASFEGISKIKAYNSIVNIAGRTLAAVIKVAIVAGLPFGI